VALDVLREADELVRVLADLDDRLARAGVRGLPDGMILDAAAEHALRAVSRQELEWALERVRHLRDALLALQVRLQGLRALKGRGASVGEQRRP
jgi:hypothetical protein